MTGGALLAIPAEEVRVDVSVLLDSTPDAVDAIRIGGIDYYDGEAAWLSPNVAYSLTWVNADGEEVTFNRWQKTGNVSVGNLNGASTTITATGGGTLTLNLIRISLQDFTLFTEVDPNNHITVVAQQISADVYGNERAYLYADKGAGHFDNFTHYVDFIHNSGDWIVCVWVVANAVGSLDQLITSPTSSIFVRTYFAYGLTRLELGELYGGAGHGASYMTISNAVRYYLKIEKYGNSIQVKVYSDANHTNLLGTLTRTLYQYEGGYRYIYPLCNYYAAVTNHDNINVYNLKC